MSDANKDHYSYEHYRSKAVAEGFDALRFGGPIGQLIQETQQAVLLRVLAPLEGRRLLDVGTGTGRAALAFAREGAIVTGVDASAGMRAVAARRAPDAGPSASFGGMLNEGVYAQFAVETSANPPVLLGLLSAYDADTAAGHCYVAFHNTGVDHPIRGRMIGAMVGFLDYLFYVAPFRKLYVDVPEYNIGIFDGFQDSLLVEEGRLHDHFFLGGRFHDRVIFAIYREAFEAISDAWYE